MQHAWTCSCCGKQHSTLLLDIACDAPDHWYQIPESEREHRAKRDNDVCIIDRKDIFVRGVIEIPIIGKDDRFRWGVWVSVSDESFDRIVELWDAPVIENEPPKPGLLCNNISEYPPTLNLKTYLHLRGGNLRPSIELELTDHPLAVDQRQGISIERVEEIAVTFSLHH